MAILILPAKQIKKQKSKTEKQILEKLQEYLDGTREVPTKILCGFWKDQQDAITYQELREAVKDGVFNEAIYQQWSQDYSILVRNKLSAVWEDAMRAGAASQPILQGKIFEFHAQAPSVLNWIRQHGTEFVTASTIEQKQAIQVLLAHKMEEYYTVDELSRLIRPCIGLTKAQVKANLNYYQNIVNTLQKDHPRMTKASVQKKAREAAAKYAEKQHRYRAMTIAQTETAFAYNRGADEGIRQAQEQNFIGQVKKRWCTSGDDVVCSICQAFEGMEIEMDKEFPFKGRTLFAGQGLVPPAHPRCACAVEYIEISPSTYINTPSISITQENSLREYNDEEIESIAKQTEEIASKHISIPSMWSGNLVISEEGVQNSNGDTIYYGKMWNCDILTKHETAPAIILHEQIHARSISYYEQKTYFQYGSIEEASVEFMVEEICKQENIEIIPSLYDDMVEALRKIGNRIGIYNTDYDFAKKLIKIPVEERMDWLSDKLYDILSEDSTITVEEYQKFSELLDRLY